MSGSGGYSYSSSCIYFISFFSYISLSYNVFTPILVCHPPRFIPLEDEKKNLSVRQLEIRFVTPSAQPPRQQHHSHHSHHQQSQLQSGYWTVEASAKSKRHCQYSLRGGPAARLDNNGPALVAQRGLRVTLPSHHDVEVREIVADRDDGDVAGPEDDALPFRGINKASERWEPPQRMFVNLRGFEVRREKLIRCVVVLGGKGGPGGGGGGGGARVEYPKDAL